MYLSLFNNGNDYGAFNNAVPLDTTTPKRVIYCVHGKPSAGCCRVLESEVLDIENINANIASNTKENSDTTRLSKSFSVFFYGMNYNLFKQEFLNSKQTLPPVKNEGK